jgi:hypothetical protein
VPAIFWAIASQSAGTGGVRLYRSDGTQVASVTPNATAITLYTVACTPNAAIDKFDVQFLSDGANTITLYGAGLYQYAS